MLRSQETMNYSVLLVCALFFFLVFGSVHMIGGQSFCKSAVDEMRSRINPLGPEFLCSIRCRYSIKVGLIDKHWQN